jgi:hypothetical protein
MPIPLENLDNKTYDELVRDALARIPIYAPSWTDRNETDPGVTFIELFAWLADMQIYSLNRIDDKSRIKFLKLLGIHLAEGSGGKDAETLNEAIGRARKDLREVTRCVTSSDYESLAMECPGIELARVKALPRFHPELGKDICNLISVVAIPNTKHIPPEISDEDLDRVRQYLEKFRILGTDLYVISPEYIKVKVNATVVRDPRYLPKTVADSVVSKLTAFLDPLTGGPQGDGWPFGRPVYISEIIQVIDNVDGVDHVVKATLEREIMIKGEEGEIEGDAEWKDEGSGPIRIQPHQVVYSEKKSHSIDADEAMG